MKLNPYLLKSTVVAALGTSLLIRHRRHCRHHQNLLVWLLIGYIAFFAFSQGAVIWVYLSDVFPNRVRAKGQSLESFSHWIMNALISGIFPLLAAKSGGYPFYSSPR